MLQILSINILNSSNNKNFNHITKLFKQHDFCFFTIPLQILVLTSHLIILDEQKKTTLIYNEIT